MAREEHQARERWLSSRPCDLARLLRPKFRQLSLARRQLLRHAGYSAWYYSAKKASRNAGLTTLYKEGDKTLEEDDQIARELITRAYQAGNQKSHLQALDWVNDFNFLTRELADRFNAYSTISQLVVTKQPQILAMGVGGFQKWTKGHAVTVYAYDGTAKAFKFYDNNFPNEVVTLA
ncbi:MAG: hypothetical protein EON94_16925 [Caulobacteraceae bacterium]|nr:MAG: hypothetical protein EON94_16925 [Caulobacteraceae bacterium]